MLERDSLDNFLARVAAAHAGFTLGLLIEGLQSYLKCALHLICTVKEHSCVCTLDLENGLPYCFPKILTQYLQC